MRMRATGWLTVTVAVTTLVWIVLTIIMQTTALPPSTVDQAIGQIILDGFYFANYANAALITVLSVAMMAGFYRFCQETETFWSTVGVLFVPIYGIANLVAYLSQIFVVPSLLTLRATPATAATAQILLGLTLQTWGPSAIAALNILGYAMLGIPSIIFGLLMARQAREMRIGGLLLALSGILSIVALVGQALNNPGLTFLVVVSGGIYFIALIPIARFFLTAPGPTRWGDSTVWPTSVWRPE